MNDSLDSLERKSRFIGAVCKIGISAQSRARVDIRKFDSSRTATDQEVTPVRLQEASVGCCSPHNCQVFQYQACLPRLF